MKDLPARLTALAALFFVYVIAGKLGLKLAFVHQSASAVWPPTGIAFAAFLLMGPRVWPAILLGAFVVNVTTKGSLATSLAIACGNTLEGVIAAWLVNRLAAGYRAFDRVPGVFKFAVLAGLLSPTISATIGVTSLALGGYANWADYQSIWLTWWLGDVAGAFVVGPLVVLWSLDPNLRWKRRQVIEAAVLLLLLLLVGFGIFGNRLPGLRHYPVEFLCIPLLIWPAFRLGRRETVTAGALLSSIAIWGTLHGWGPFAGQAPNDSLLLLQAYMGVLTITAVAAAAAVNERDVVEKTLRESEERFSAMFNQVDVGVAETDLTGRFDLANAGFCRIAGRSADDLLRLRVRDLVHPDDRSRNIQLFEGVIRGDRSAGIEERYVRPDGSLVWVHSTVSLVRDSALRPRYVVAVVQDIGDRKEAEQERRRLLAREQSARAEAEEANRLKDEFLATVSHELRTPLTAVLGWARMLRNRHVDAETTEHALEVIERNARAQAQLIEELLDVSRIVSGKLRLDARPVDLSEILTTCMEGIRPAAETKGLRLSAGLDSASDPIWADPHRVQQIFLNLLSNAVKFTPEGGRVEVTLQRVESFAEVAISDTGKGIRAEFIPYLFEPFRQADATSTRAHGGLGLGLAIVRQLVELHGGSVRAASPGENQGSTFRVRLPLAAAQQPSETRAQTPKATAARPASLAGLRVLVVEDDADAREFIASALRHQGASVSTAGSTPEALDALQRSRPDVLVSDIAMPGDDGHALIRKVREAEATRGDGRPLPAIALTAYAREEDRLRALEAGYQLHLTKPVEPVDLAAAVADCARGSKSGAGPAA